MITLGPLKSIRVNFTLRNKNDLTLDLFKLVAKYDDLRGRLKGMIVLRECCRPVKCPVKYLV